MQKGGLLSVLEAKRWRMVFMISGRAYIVFPDLVDYLTTLHFFEVIRPVTRQSVLALVAFLWSVKRTRSTRRRSLGDVQRSSYGLSCKRYLSRILRQEEKSFLVRDTLLYRFRWRLGGSHR